MYRTGDKQYTLCFFNSLKSSNKSSFWLKNPYTRVLRFMTQVPPYFKFSHIAGTKIVFSVKITIMHYMITYNMYFSIQPSSKNTIDSSLLQLKLKQVSTPLASTIASFGFTAASLQYKLWHLWHILLIKILIKLLEQLNIQTYTYMCWQDCGFQFYIAGSSWKMKPKQMYFLASFRQEIACPRVKNDSFSVNKKIIENYHRIYFSIYYYLLRWPIKVTDEFGIDSRTSEPNARHFHLINSNQVQDESGVYIPGMPNVFTTLGYLTFRMKIKITLRKN